MLTLNLVNLLFSPTSLILIAASAALLIAIGVLLRGLRPGPRDAAHKYSARAGETVRLKPSVVPWREPALARGSCFECTPAVAGLVQRRGSSPPPPEEFLPLLELPRQCEGDWARSSKFLESSKSGSNLPFADLR